MLLIKNKSLETILNKKKVKNPNPKKLIITEFILNSSLYSIKILPIKPIIPLINGKRYKKESSTATTVYNR